MSINKVSSKGQTDFNNKTTGMSPGGSIVEGTTQVVGAAAGWVGDTVVSGTKTLFGKKEQEKVGFMDGLTREAEKSLLKEIAKKGMLVCAGGPLMYTTLWIMQDMVRDISLLLLPKPLKYMEDLVDEDDNDFDSELAKEKELRDKLVATLEGNESVKNQEGKVEAIVRLGVSEWRHWLMRPLLLPYTRAYQLLRNLPRAGSTPVAYVPTILLSLLLVGQTPIRVAAARGTALEVALTLPRMVGVFGALSSSIWCTFRAAQLELEIDRQDRKREHVAANMEPSRAHSVDSANAVTANNTKSSLPNIDDPEWHLVGTGKSPIPAIVTTPSIAVASADIAPAILSSAAASITGNTATVQSAQIVLKSTLEEAEKAADMSTAELIVATPSPSASTANAAASNVTQTQLPFIARSIAALNDLTSRAANSISSRAQLALLSWSGLSFWMSGAGFVLNDLYLPPGDAKSTTNINSNATLAQTLRPGGLTPATNENESVAVTVSNRLKMLFSDSFAGTAVSTQHTFWGLVWEWGPAVSFCAGGIAYVCSVHSSHKRIMKRRRWRLSQRPGAEQGSQKPVNKLVE